MPRLSSLAAECDGLRLRLSVRVVECGGPRRGCSVQWSGVEGWAWRLGQLAMRNVPVLWALSVVGLVGSLQASRGVLVGVDHSHVLAGAGGGLCRRLHPCGGAKGGLGMSNPTGAGWCPSRPGEESGRRRPFYTCCGHGCVVCVCLPDARSGARVRGLCLSTRTPAAGTGAWSASAISPLRRARVLGRLRPSHPCGGAGGSRMAALYDGQR